MSLRRSLAAALEWRAPIALSLPFSPLGSPVRALALPEGLAVVGVGGATLGGSGRTPLAIGIALGLVARGHDVVFVGHGYGGQGRGAVVVGAATDPREVGDEAVLAAAALPGALPVVAGERVAALALAARLGRVAVVDRLLQARPTPLASAVLAVDARDPWGSGRLFPLGDLVAKPESLRSLADEVVAVGGPEAPAVVRLVGAVGGRLGLITSCARPNRVCRSAASLGEVVFHVKRGDHAPLGCRELERLQRLAERHRLDAWLLDAKTDVALRPEGGALALPHARIEHRVVPTDRLLDRLCQRVRASMRAR